MKKTLLILTLIINIICFSQENSQVRPRMMQKINEIRVNMILNRMALLPEQDMAFRPLLMDYAKKTMENKKQIIKLKGISPEKISDIQAQEIINSHFEEAKQNIILREEFYRLAIKIISPKQMLKVFHLDKKFDEELKQRLHHRKKKEPNIDDQMSKFPKD